jgi:hypothetical protein
VRRKYDEKMKQEGCKEIRTLAKDLVTSKRSEELAELFKNAESIRHDVAWL